MSNITVNYALKWQFKNYPYIQLKDSRHIFNMRTGRRIKLTTNGGSVGIWLGRVFIIKAELNSHIQRIPKKEVLPF